MTKINELIKQLCPEGVKFVRLESLVQSIKTGLNPRSNFKLNTEDAVNYYVTVKEFTSGKIIFNNKTDRINDEAVKIIQNRSKLEPGDVLFSGIGTIGKVAIVDISTDNWNCSESVFLIKAKKEILSPQFLMYVLCSEDIKNQYLSQSVGSTLKGVRMGTLAGLFIPIPPLAIQEEIVNILDSFTTLEAELEAELEARKKQYTYYRDSLLSFEGKDVEWKTLGQVGEFVRGNGLQKKDFTESGVGCIHYGQIYTYYGTYTDKTKSFVSPELAKKLKKVNKGDLIITNTSENFEDVCKTVAWLGDYEIVTGGHATIFKHKENSKFLAYYTQTAAFFNEKKKYAQGAKVIDVSAKNLAKILVPIPPKEEQERIVSILDKLDALVNSISFGLPAEIKTRRKQYEYYRNQLLTFNSVSNE